MIPKTTSRLWMFAALLLLTNCASITTGTKQEMEIASEPSNAACVVEQDGKVLASIMRTPKTVAIGKSWSDLFITCAKEGYLTDITRVTTEFQGATLGNALIGGGIGLMIDASNGTMRKYPDAYIAYLIPERFDSLASANQFFDGLIQRVTERHNEKYAYLTSQCKNADDHKSNCDQRIREVNSILAKEKERIESARRRSLNALTQS